MFGLSKADRERLEALERRVRDLEKAELELEELRRTATNAVRSLRRMATNVLEASQKAEPDPARGNGPPSRRKTLLDQLRGAG